MNNFLTVTKTEEHVGRVLGELKTFLREYMEAGKPVFTTGRIDQMKHETDGEGDSETVQKIKHLLDEYVGRP